jgi:hypothetical protein
MLGDRPADYLNRGVLMKAVPLLLALVVVGCDDPDLAPVRPSPIASTLTLEATPAVVFRSGSTTRVTARVTDTNGTRVSGTPVEFSTDTGTLDTTWATTNENGTATVTLTAAETATVRASAVGMNRELTVTGLAPFTLTVAPAQASVVVGTPTTIRLLVVSAPAGKRGALYIHVDRYAYGHGDGVRQRLDDERQRPSGRDRPPGPAGATAGPDQSGPRPRRHDRVPGAARQPRRHV